MTLFDITGSDIAQLSDTDLRTLIAELCRAELHHKGLPISAVTAGGHQNSADGGLDVKVELSAPITNCDFVPRAITGFQVKVPDMPRAKILEEIAPQGIVRPILKELAQQGGSYIIVSSRGSTADTSLRNRRKAIDLLRK